MIDIYNQEGKKKGQARLPKEIFGNEVKNDLIHQVFVSLRANSRQPLAHTKDRSEKRGGGAKPWRQKGTGRARHGSRRSPLWKGGGVTFGPRKEKNYGKQIPRKMKKAALLSALSGKARDKEIILLEDFKIQERKTKFVVELLNNIRKNLEDKKAGILIALPSGNKDIKISSNNIPKVKTIEVRNLNILDLLKYKYIVLTKDSIKNIKEVFVK